MIFYPSKPTLLIFLGQPDGASFYGNYGSGNVSSYSTGGVSFMTPGKDFMACCL